MNNILNKIASSSKGNCYVYNKDLMIDIGVPYSKVKDIIKDIKIICLTHQHLDHLNIKTLQKIIYNYPNIHIICGIWLVEKLKDNNISLRNIWVVRLDQKYDLGKYFIEPVMAIHDVGNCGYKITIKSNNYKIFHISDTSSIEHIKAKDYDWYSIEGNYDLDEVLNSKIIEAEHNGEFTYLKRVKETHLSQLQALNWLQENMGENSQYEFIHQSDNNG